MTKLFCERSVWECDAGARKELTSAGIVASKLMGTPIEGKDDFEIHHGHLSFVTYESSDAAPGGSPEQREKVEEMIHKERLRDLGKETPVHGDGMEVDDVGGTHVPSTTFVTPEVRTARFPPGASIPQRPDDMAWGTESGETNETKILMLEFISAIRNNCDHMNPVDIKRLQRKLELRAADLDALSIFTLRALKPTLDKIPENLQICPDCHLGITPGIQVCPRCKFVLTTIQSKVKEMVKGSLIAMATDAAVACVDNRDEGVEEVERQRQPEDMDENMPRRAPIGCANPQVLNISYLAQGGHENFIKVNCSSSFESW